jgi:molybdate transport repressor ModE-like protein/molybdopterin-binding protein
MNLYEVTVDTCHRQDSYAWLRLRGGRLASRLWDGIRPGQHARVRVPPTDVILCSSHPGQVSARNVLPGRVASLRHTPEGVYVAMDVGFPLTALVTRRAARDLDLKRGVRVFALVKAVAVVPNVPVRARFRVSIEGAAGTLDPSKLDLLRAIERTGSLSAAARESGITFRTAWDWIEAAHRAWGSALVVRSQGGRGGGGTVLTAEARALLQSASKIENA